MTKKEEIGAAADRRLTALESEIRALRLEVNQRHAEVMKLLTAISTYLVALTTKLSWPVKLNTLEQPRTRFDDLEFEIPPQTESSVQPLEKVLKPVHEEIEAKQKDVGPIDCVNENEYNGIDVDGPDHQSTCGGGGDEAALKVGQMQNLLPEIQHGLGKNNSNGPLVHTSKKMADEAFRRIDVAFVGLVSHQNNAAMYGSNFDTRGDAIFEQSWQHIPGSVLLHYYVPEEASPHIKTWDPGIT